MHLEKYRCSLRIRRNNVPHKEYYYLGLVFLTEYIQSSLTEFLLSLISPVQCGSLSRITPTRRGSKLSPSVTSYSKSRNRITPLYNSKQYDCTFLATKFIDVQSDLEYATEKVQYKSTKVDRNSFTGVVFGQKHEK